MQQGEKQADRSQIEPSDTAWQNISGIFHFPEGIAQPLYAYLL
jgi:hypothetical protein